MTRFGASEPAADNDGRRGARSRSGASANPRAQRTRAALIAAITELADEGAPGGTLGRLTIAQVSRRAGVSASSFYAHFDGIPALLRGALAHHLRAVEFRYLERTGSSRGELSASQLREVIAEVLAELDRFHGLLLALPYSPADASSGGVLDVFRESVAASLVRRPPGIPASSLHMVSSHVAGAILAVYTAHPGPREREQVLDVLVALTPTQLTARADPGPDPGEQGWATTQRKE